MQFTVIIPCKNEVGIVDTLLECLRNQTLVADEIIIVDSHSSDGTAEHVKKIASQLPLQVVAAPKKGVAEARNYGARKARNEWLFFIDADISLPNDFFAQATVEISRRNLQAGGFTQRMPSKKAGLRIGARAMNGYARIMQHTPWPIAFSLLFSSRKIFDIVGGFDPTIYIMEDYNFVLEAKRRNAHVGIVNAPFIASDRRYIHAPPSTLLNGFYAEFYRYTHGLRITKPLFTYDMGGEQNTKDKSSRNTKN